MIEHRMTRREIFDHAFHYASTTAGAIRSVATAYARHYCNIVEDESDATYWPGHRDEFFRWIKRQPIKDLIE